MEVTQYFPEGSLKGEHKGLPGQLVTSGSLPIVHHSVLLESLYLAVFIQPIILHNVERI